MEPTSDVGVKEEKIERCVAAGRDCGQVWTGGRNTARVGRPGNQPGVKEEGKSSAELSAFSKKMQQRALFFEKAEWQSILRRSFRVNEHLEQNLRQVSGNLPKIFTALL